MENNYNIKFYDQHDLDPYDCNIDIEVCFHDGRRYSCTVFTLKNIERLFAKYNSSGEYLSGKYFYCPDMIVICFYDKREIELIIEDIVNSGNVEIAMKLLDN